MGRARDLVAWIEARRNTGQKLNGLERRRVNSRKAKSPRQGRTFASYSTRGECVRGRAILFTFMLFGMSSPLRFRLTSSSFDRKTFPPPPSNPQTWPSSSLRTVDPPSFAKSPFPLNPALFPATLDLIHPRIGLIRSIYLASPNTVEDEKDVVEWD